MASPGLDDYERSVFLTLAQEKLVKLYMNPMGNKYKEGFEGSEKRRIDLKELITDYKNNTQLPNLDNKISPDSVIYQIPNNIFQIINEKVKIKDPCSVGKSITYKSIPVIPKTHDEYNIQINNPFKKPNNSKVWRLDYNSIQPGVEIVELLSNQQIFEYQMRYVKFPEPIILSPLIDNLSIHGQTAERTSELRESIHSEIIRTAVELATLSYKEDSLANLVGVYNNKE
jgi:hypothetical protein